MCPFVSGKQWLWRLLPALLLGVLLLLASLYNICSSSCSSDSLWLSLSSLPPRLSLSAPEFSPIENPISKPGLRKQDFIVSVSRQTHPTSSPISTQEQGKLEETMDSEMKEKEADQAFNPKSAEEFEFVDSEDLNNHAILPKSSDYTKNGTQMGPSTTIPSQHGGLSFKAPKLEEDLLGAREAVTSSIASGDTRLHAPVYHNLSLFIKSYELMEQMFKIYIYTDGHRPLVHEGPTKGIYASEGQFISQLQSSKRFVTRDTRKAHLFFLPFSVTNMVKELYVPDSHDMSPITNFVTSYVHAVASKYPYWNRSRGADHFFVSCHDWGPATARGHSEFRHNSIKVVCNADTMEEFVVGKDVSLPETYLHRVKPPTKLGGPPPRKRPYLAFFAGHMHGRVRPVLLQHWKDKDPDMKIYEMLPAAIAKRVSYIRHLKMSKFCICPMGYEVNSPRIVEAILYDCVPVVVADNFVLPFSEVLNWHAFAVFVKEEEVPQLKEILLSILPSKYGLMQARLKHVRQHFMWHFKRPVKYDIFHMVLHSLWLQRLASVLVNLP